jgi:DNA-binding transcriptional regulator LsrR (DeoR family)
MNQKQFNPIELQKVAALYCEGMKRESIAETLSRDENDIQRMIEYARQCGLFSEQPLLTLDTLSPEVQEFVYNETLTKKLKDALGEKIELGLAPITITPSPTSMFTTFHIDTTENSEPLAAYTKAEGDSLELVCRRAAQELMSFLLDDEPHIVGLNYGVIVRDTIKHIHPLPSQLSGAKLSVVSLFGDLEFHSPDQVIPPLRSLDVNCNNMVSQLVQRMGGQAEAVPLNVPGFIPAQFAFSEQTFDAIQSLLTSHSSYRRIFGAPPTQDSAETKNLAAITKRPAEAMISHMDTIITGFGAADNYTVLSHYLNSWLDKEEIETLLEYCHAGKVVGDIGGHLISPSEAKDDNDLINFLLRINRRTLAAQPSDFIHVASRHLKSRKGAGVLGIAAGARKAKILSTLLSRSPCPISRLVIDTHCALALLDSIDPKEFKRFVSDEGKRFVETTENWSESTRKLIPV